MHTRCKHKLTSIVAEECTKHAGGGKQQGGNKLHCVRWCHNEVTHTYGGRNCTVLSLTLSFCPFILLSNRMRGREVKQVVKISNSFQAQIKWNTKYYEGKCCGETEQFELFIYFCNLCCCNPSSVICHWYRQWIRTKYAFWSCCGSGGTAGHLLIRRMVVQSLLQSAC